MLVQFFGFEVAPEFGLDFFPGQPRLRVFVAVFYAEPLGDCIGPD